MDRKYLFDPTKKYTEKPRDNHEFIKLWNLYIFGKITFEELDRKCKELAKDCKEEVEPFDPKCPF